MTTVKDALQTIRFRLGQWIGDVALKRLVKNASLLFGAETIVTLISVVQFPLVTRWLGPENYGLWGLVTSWVDLIGPIVSLRTWETLTKFFGEFLVSQDEARALAILKLCALISFSVGTITFVFISLTAGWASDLLIKHPSGADLIRLEALHGLLMTSMGLWMVILRVCDRFRVISTYNVISATVQFMLTLLALWAGLGVVGMILVATVVNSFQTLALYILAERELRKRFSGHWLRADLRALSNRRREISVMLFSMNIDSLRKSVMGNADTLMLGWFTTPAQVGVYRLARQLASYFGRLTNPIYETLYPEVTRLYAAEGPTRVRKLVRRLTWGIVVGLGILFTGAYLLSGWLVPIIFGSKYAPAIPVFYIVLLTNIWAILLWAPSVMMAAGRARQLTTINTACSLIMVILLFILVPRWGSIGAAVSAVAFHVIWLSLMYFATRKVLATPIPAPTSQ